MRQENKCIVYVTEDTVQRDCYTVYVMKQHMMGVLHISTS